VVQPWQYPKVNWEQNRVNNNPYEAGEKAHAIRARPS